MATSKEFKDFVVEELTKTLGDVTCRSMMGEYLLYFQGTLFGGIYDGRVLIKIVEENKKFGLAEEVPYKSAKPMFMIEDIENSDLTREIIFATLAGLSKKGKK